MKIITDQNKLLIKRLEYDLCRQLEQNKVKMYKKINQMEKYITKQIRVDEEIKREEIKRQVKNNKEKYGKIKEIIQELNIKI